MSAHRAGIRRVIMPRRNEKDLQDIPSNILVGHTTVADGRDKGDLQDIPTYNLVHANWDNNLIVHHTGHLNKKCLTLRGIKQGLILKAV